MATIYDDYKLVAAIDFGTTFSGYAFALREDGKIIENPKWGSTGKTPTSLLLGNKGEYRAFGFAAEEEYLNSDDDDGNSCHLYSQFKMLLHRQENLSRDTQVKSTDGSTQSALKIFSLMLREMKHHLLQHLKTLKEPYNSINEQYIRWVVTVPAIWTDDSKRFMREAALEARLISELRSTQLMIALEPEAGALYCQSLDAGNFAIQTSDSGQRMEEGTKYLVVDCGGGTVDIATHQVMEHGYIKELYFPTGGAWGGTGVDKMFEKVLTFVFGKDVLDDFKNKDHQIWRSLLENFITKKHAFTGDKEVLINVPYALGEVCKKVTSNKIEDIINRCSATLADFLMWLKNEEQASDSTCNQEKYVLHVVDSQDGSIPLIRMHGGNLKIPSKVFGYLYDGVIDSTIKHLEDLMKTDKRMSDVKYLLMVGGFSESKYLQKKMKDKFADINLHVLIPQDASLAVVKGAVLFGLKPYIIQSRVAAMTYGTRTNRDFKEGDPISKKRMVEGKEKCKDVFSVFVTKGESMPMGDVKTFTYHPLYSDQTEIKFELLSCSRENVKYTDEDDVFQIDKMTVKMPVTTGGKSRKAVVEVKIGGTELFVKAQDITAGDTANTSVKFVAE